MPNPTGGPSHFPEVKSVVYNSNTPVNIFSCMNIRINRNVQYIKGEDNNKRRPVSAHAVRINETVTFETDDIFAIEGLSILCGQTGGSGANSLTFTWVAAASQVGTTNALPNQAVTIKNLVIERVNTDALSKGLGKATVEGSILEVSDDSDPVVFATGS